MSRLPEPPPGLQARCDDLLANVQAQMVALQPAYLAVHGSYWQGIVTHAVLPDGGNETAPDPTRRPTDQAEDWPAVGMALPGTMPLGVSVDVYAGPLGQGYIIRGLLTIARRTWARAIGVGPEPRSHDWLDVTPGGTP